MNFFQRVFQSAQTMSDKQQAKAAQRQQQYQQRFQTAYEKLTGVPPDLQPRRKQGKYVLEKHIIHKGKQGITVHLHGHSENKKHNKRIEYIPLNYLPDGSLLTDNDILRCAAFLSPHEWVIPRGDNIPQVAQRAARSNEVARGGLSCCCAFCEEGGVPPSRQQAGAVTKRGPEAAVYYTAYLLQSRCASRGNIRIFGGKWNGPLDPRLQPALTDPNRISSSNG